MYPEEVKNFITGEYSAEDEAFVKKWIEDHPTRKQRLEELKNIWAKTESLQLAQKGDLEKAWSSLEPFLKREKDKQYNTDPYNYNSERKAGVWNLFLKVAAVIVLAAGLFLIQQQMQVEMDRPEIKSKKIFSTIRSDFGKQLKVRLRDGTVVRLNAGSKIRYNNFYGRGNRKLYLSGEAYFEVNNRGQEHPFIVKTEKASVKDIGTAFNVTAYEDGPATDVIVSKGKVEVLAARDSLTAEASVLVTEGNMVSISGQYDSLIVKKADLDEALGWLSNRLIFDNEPFENITRRLERYYNIDIIIDDDVLKSKVIKASFKNEDVEKVMSVLAISLDAEYEINGNKILFRKKGSVIKQ